MRFKNRDLNGKEGGSGLWIYLAISGHRLLFLGCLMLNVGNKNSFIDVEFGFCIFFIFYFYVVHHQRIFHFPIYTLAERLKESRQTTPAQCNYFAYGTFRIPLTPSPGEREYRTSGPASGAGVACECGLTCPVSLSGRESWGRARIVSPTVPTCVRRPPGCLPDVPYSG